MTHDRLKLTRNQLSAFLKDPKAITQFERLFDTVDVISPDGFSEVSIAAENAGSLAQQALDTLQRIENLLELLALSPIVETTTDDLVLPPINQLPPEGDLMPPIQLGTMAQQQADRVNITGGVVTAQLENNQTILLKTTTALANGAAAAAGTLLNAPVAGNPTKWVAIDDNGTTRYVPTW